MYISKPPISVSSDPQKSPATKVNRLTPEAPTPLAVKDRGHELRHPSSRKFQSRATALGLTDINEPAPDHVSQDKSDLPDNEY